MRLILTLKEPGYFSPEYSRGGGHYAPPPQISAMNAPIDAKIGTDVEHVIKNKNLKKKKLIRQLIFFLIINI